MFDLDGRPAGAVGMAELSRIAVLEREGELTSDEAWHLRELAELDVVERVSDTRFDCLLCGGVGSIPVHRLDCALYRKPAC